MFSVAECADASRPLITYEVRGDGFLRHMVRSIVGTLVEIGRGRHPAEWMREVLASRIARAAGPTAPAARDCFSVAASSYASTPDL